MKFTEFECIMSKQRMSRYVSAVSGNTQKSMTLYRKNLRLSQEMFTIISVFEVALRNAINSHYSELYGQEWLKLFVSKGGIFDKEQTIRTKKLISEAKHKLNRNYSHSKLVAELDFGLWRYLFAKPQFRAGGQSLLDIFPSKAKSSATIQYNHSYIFNELAKLNQIRNRIAHHEPICFRSNSTQIDTTLVRQNYNLILQLFQWMNINSSELLYGLDHILEVCNKIDKLKE